MQYTFWLGEDSDRTLDIEHAFEALGVGSDAMYEAEKRVSKTRSTGALAVQVGGSHYKKYTIQPIQYAMANNLNYCQANAVKYVTRYRDKGGVEDLRKAIHNIELLIEMENEKEKPRSQGTPFFAVPTPGY